MTNREFYENLKNYENLTDEQKAELIQFADAALEKLNKQNEARKEATARKAVEKEAERAPIRDAIVACITDEPKTATTLIAESGLEIKPQTIPSLLKGLVASGVIAKAPVKVKGKSPQVGYIKA